jgi:YbbR domain-containing protein
MIRLITDHLALKLVSLTVAVLLWFATVGADPEMTAAVAVPVQYRNIPENFDISSDLTPSAYVQIRGAGSRLSSSNLANAVAVVDLTGESRPGERTFSIDDDNVVLPPGVRFLRAVPSQVRLRLEPRASRTVPVLVRYAAIPEGYRIARQEVVPAEVAITGPQSRVGNLNRVQTDPIEITAGETTYKARPFVGDDQVRLAIDQMISVKVTVERIR